MPSKTMSSAEFEFQEGSIVFSFSVRYPIGVRTSLRIQKDFHQIDFSNPRWTLSPSMPTFLLGAGLGFAIGKGFAMMEAQLVLATMAQHVALDLIPGHPVVAEPVVTLRPKFGLKMVRKARSGVT